MPLKVLFALRLAPAIALFFIAAPAFAAPVPLATYRAVHDMAVDTVSSAEGGGILGGRLVTEFAGSSCDGYTTTTRFVTEGVDGDGNDQLSDQRSKTVETADGTMEFDNETYTDSKLTDRSQGIAKRDGDTITVKLREPSRKTFTLDAGVAFPTEQMTRVIDAAREGKHFLVFDVYDGSVKNGEGVQATATVIGPASTAVDDVGDETPIAEAGLAGVRHWPITVSYFDKDNGQTDEAPYFTLSSIMYENGILRRVRMDFGKFSLVGKLTQLDATPATACAE